MRLPEGLEQRITQTIQKIEGDKQMPYVTSWERMAKEEGWQEGRQEGLQEGILSSLKLQIAHRFGELSKTTETKLRKLSSEQLQTLLVALLDFQTKADLHAWLKQHAPANGAARKQNGQQTKREGK